MSLRLRLLFPALGLVALAPFIDEALFSPAPWHLPAFLALFLLVLALVEPPRRLSLRAWLEQLSRRLASFGRSGEQD